MVGVEEACSGVRGLQTSLMVSLVLGELGRFSVSRRFILVLAGAFVAILLNLLRAIVLSGLAATQGVTAVDEWHDTVGFIEFGGILAAMMVAYWLLKAKSAQVSHRSGHGALAGFRPMSASISVIALLVLIGGDHGDLVWASRIELLARHTLDDPTAFRTLGDFSQFREPPHSGWNA